MYESILSGTGLQSKGLNTITTTGIQEPSLSDINVGDAIDLAGQSVPLLGGALSVADLLGFDVTRNISNVFTYGLSSWGASTNPQEEETKIAINMEKLTAMIGSINDTNMQEVLNSAELLSTYLEQYYKRMLSRRSWAGSTEAAFKVHHEAFGKFRNEVLLPLISKLKGLGVKFATKTITQEFSFFEREFLPWQKADNTSSEKNGTFTYNVFALTLPESTISNSGTINEGETKQGAGMGVLGLIGLGVLGKIFKLY